MEILKIQGNKNFKNITKLLPPHLITNKLAFQINKNKDFIEALNDNINNLNNNNDNEEQDEENVKENNEEENNNLNSNNDELDQKLDKYNLFFKLLQEDI